METLIYILILFVILSALLKLSFWRWWQAAIYSATIALTTVLLFGNWAVEQSKTQLADYLQNSAALNNMAMVITLETIATYRFTAFPPLLLFPVSFYLLTQIIFANPGTSFEPSTGVVALTLGIGLPLLARAVCWLLPEREFRRELLIILTTLLCVLGLLSTQSGKIIIFT